MDPAAVASWIREATFPRRAPSQARIGIEGEFLALDAETHAVPSLQERVLPMIERHALRHGWTGVPSSKGAPRFDVPGGGSFTFEPGGQVEYATPPFESPSRLLAHMRATVQPLIEYATDAGIALVGAGIDPFNTIENVPLQIDAERYRAMDAYFATIGEAGARMMRQTASIQVNVDAGSDGERTWRMLNAATPFITAMFANSAVYARTATGYASSRARTWQLLDPSRTGLAWNGCPAASGYLEFALDAVAMFVRSECGEHLPFREWVASGLATPQSTAMHLSTLFPDVRARGWFEVRSIDAQPVESYAAVVALIAGLAMDGGATLAASELLGSPDPMLLPVAAREGLRDARLATTAADLAAIAMKACAEGDLLEPTDLDAAAEFFDRFTQRGRSPADDARTSGAIATAA
jgi:glutamate--cysteine ligase